MATKKSSKRSSKQKIVKIKNGAKTKKVSVKNKDNKKIVRLAFISKFTDKLKKTSENEKLKRLNMIAAALHFVQAVVIIMLSKNVSLPITVNYLTTDQLASKDGGPVLVAATTEILSVNLGYLVAAFLLMSAVAHLLVTTVYRKNYEAGLKNNINKARWLEYALSASTMMVAISMLVGIYDEGSLIMIFGLAAVMNLLGLAMEIHNQKQKSINWLSFIIGSVAGIIPWIVFVTYLVHSVQYGQSGPPVFVYFILGSIFFLFNCFAVNMYLQYKKKGKWADYIYGEKAYIVLSLVAKTALAWQVFAGTLRP